MAKNMNKLFKSNPERVYEACRKVIADSGYTVINSSREFTYCLHPHPRRGNQ
jgi:hypothetical protein